MRLKSCLHISSVAMYYSVGPCPCTKYTYALLMELYMRYLVGWEGGPLKISVHC
jgi:hypothetical protein